MEKLYEILQQVSVTSKTASTTERMQEVRAQLEAYVSELIQHDFPQLVELLYRVDVNEKRLKELLTQHTSTNSATLIADLLIERQLQKQAWRQAHPPDSDIPDDERW